MKNEKNIYHTSQKEILIRFFCSHPDEDFSTDQIMDALCGENIGKSTVYRLISRLCDDGRILRTAGSGKKVYYRYIDEEKACDQHFHLKCRDCGRIIHLECHHIEEFCEHIAGSHGFKLDPRYTVINGICEKCDKKEVSV